MAGQKTIRSTYVEPPAATLLVADYIVTAAIAPGPDCRGNYYYWQDIGDEPAYTRQDGAFRLYYSPIPDHWYIESLGPEQQKPQWRSPTSYIVGIYEPSAYSTGNPVVSTP